jgi:hypothetical protein
MPLGSGMRVVMADLICYSWLGFPVGGGRGQSDLVRKIFPSWPLSLWRVAKPGNPFFLPEMVNMMMDMHCPDV